MLDISDHPLISGLGLAGELLEAQVVVAEVLLGLDGVTYTGDELEVQKAAIATQVRFQVSEGFDATKFASVNRDRRSWAVHPAARDGISPVAKKLAASLTDTTSSSNTTGAGYRVLTSLP